ncbi:MAG: hypothetical protein EA424_24230, partial [Planctomycetaceae bacterium]
MNKVNSAAEASIDFKGNALDARWITAGGGVSVTAEDTATIDATLTLGSKSASSDASALGISGAISVNDVRGGATAFIDHTTLTANGGDVLVRAVEAATLTAAATSELTASRSSSDSGAGDAGSSGGGTSLVVGGLIATNLVQSGADAILRNSDVKPTDVDAGGVSVEAENKASLTATVVNGATASSSGDGSDSGATTAIGVTLAFNTIGWKSQNVLFNTVDAILGDPLIAEAFGGQHPSNATATIVDTTIAATGPVSADAVAAAKLDSAITNTTTATAEGTQGGTGTGVGIVVSMNKVNSAAEATMKFTSGALATNTIIASGGVAVSARDAATIDATLDLKAAAQASGGAAGDGGKAVAVGGAVSLNDVRGGAAAELLNATVDAKGGSVLVSAEEAASLNAKLNVEAQASGQGSGGNTSSLAIGGLIATNLVLSDAVALLSDSDVTAGGNVAVTATNTAKLNAELSNKVTNDPEAPVSEANNIAVTLAFNTIGWASQNVLFNTVDALPGDPLIAEAFGGNIGSGANATVRNTVIAAGGKLSIDAVSSATLDATVHSLTDSTALGTPSAQLSQSAKTLSLGFVIAMNKVSSAAEARLGFTGSTLSTQTITANGGVSVSATDSAAIDAKLDIKATSQATNPTADKPRASAASGLVALNDVRGGAGAVIYKATVTVEDGDVLVEAIERATIDARLNTETESRVSPREGSSSLAVSGVIATNLVLSHADAEILGSDVTTTDGGDVIVAAINTSRIVAEIHNETTSNGTSVGVTLAFNSIGWEAQNFLFNTVDALLGTGIANPNPATVRAMIRGTDVSAAGAIHVTATSEAVIDASVETSATAIVGSVQDSTTGVSVAAVLAMNKANTQVRALIENAAVVRTTAGDVRVQASDVTSVNAYVNAPVLTVSASTDKATSVSVGLSLARNEIVTDMLAFVRNVDELTADGGSIHVTSDQDASIDATSTASAISVALSVDKSIAFGGGGATAVNSIRGQGSAFIQDSQIVATGTGAEQGEVVVTATNRSHIEALVKALSVAVAASTGKTQAISIGFSLARNLIGWTEYGGSDPIDVLAYIENSDVTADQGLTLTASSTAEILATVAATSVAVALTVGSGTAISAGGLWTDNKIATRIKAFLTGASVVDLGDDLVITASDQSNVVADARAVSVAASLAAERSGAISIGLSLAHNTVDNGVEAYLDSAELVKTGGGDVLITATDSSTIAAKSVAASLALSIGAGSTSFGISGGGSESTNVILGKAEALISGSTLGETAADIGDVRVVATGASEIDALVAAVSGSVAIGSTTGAAVSIGISAARNFIGWDPGGGASLITTYTSDQSAGTLVPGQTVRIARGPGRGDVYQYIGPVLVDYGPDANGCCVIHLATQNYQDTSLWKQIISPSAAQLLAYLENTSVTAAGDLTVSAMANYNIDAVVLAGSVAIGGGGTTGIAVSGAGVFAQNKILRDTKAFIDGDGPEGISAHAVTVRADDASGISAIAGAASLAGSVAGTTGVAVSIGLSVALNEISGDVAAYIANAEQGVTTTDGSVSLSAVSQGLPLFDFNLQAAGLTAEDLDDASEADQNDPDTPANEATLDAAADIAILTKLRAVFAANGETLAIPDTVAVASMYTTDDGSQNLREGDTVRLVTGFTGTGIADRVYRYIGPDRDNVNLEAENYGDAANWLLVDKLKISKLEEERGWVLVAPDGATFLLVLSDDGGKVSVSRSSINAISAAASLAVGLGGTTGLAVSGAGAVAQNVVLTRTNAYAENSLIESAGDVELSATSVSGITSTVVAASLAVGGGGTTGIGASIGVGVARNFIGFKPGGDQPEGQVRAYLRNTSVDADGELTQTALAAQTISSLVVAGSVAVGVGVAVSIGISLAHNEVANKVA